MQCLMFQTHVSDTCRIPDHSIISRDIIVSEYTIETSLSVKNKIDKLTTAIQEKGYLI